MDFPLISSKSKTIIIMESFFKQGRKCINYSVSSYDVYTQFDNT